MSTERTAPAELHAVDQDRPRSRRRPARRVRHLGARRRWGIAARHARHGRRVPHPDEARPIGVRLIEAAALADGDRAIRRAPGGGQ